MTSVPLRGDDDYPEVVEKTTRVSPDGIGLCADCSFMRKMASDRGSTFYLCQRSVTDPSFPKYPRLPVLQCAGYERLVAESTNTPEDPLSS